LSIAIKNQFEKLSSAIKGTRVSEPVFAEPAIKLSTQELFLLNALPDGITLHRIGGKAVWASKTASKLFNLEASDLTGLGFLQGVNPQDQVSILQAMSDCFEGYETSEINIRKLQNIDSSKPQTQVLECRCSLYETENGEQSEPYVLLITRDVTRQSKFIEDADHKTGMAESANQVKSSFISNISHELRTPLNAIIGFSEMIEGKVGVNFPDETKIEYASLINQSATHILALVNDVLDVSKIEAGEYQLSSEPFDFCEATASTLKMMQPIAQKANISVRLESEDDLPLLCADQRAVRQIMFNLVANAIKFSSSGSEVFVSAKRTARTMRIEILDSGVGMDAQTLEKLGAAFFQAQQTSRQKNEGTGLGLSIVYGLVALHKGNISFESDLGKGTRAIVELPLNAIGGKPVPSDPDDSIIFLKDIQKPVLPAVKEQYLNKKTTG